MPRVRLPPQPGITALSRIALCVVILVSAPTGPVIEPFGFMENGLQTAEYYRPSQKRFADALVRAAAKNTPLDNAVALAGKYQNG